MNKPAPFTARAVLSDPFHCLAFGAGAGLIPYAPGTAGTLVALPVYTLLQPLSLSLYLAVLVVMLAVGTWICGRASVALGVHDHSGIVWDEIVGYLITMLTAPPGWGWMLAGFVVFRLFDIAKPWPVSLIDRRMGGGAGIMLDDIVAGLYALVAMHVLAMFF
ncbi:MAG: phosphatidylglycerophosphatase A [Gammaproteobacteria bacterium]|nr:phosphatidylglycerophosphatase A [Gammaproteobacteria bacterium]